MIENIPDPALQVLLAVVAIATVVAAFMQSTNVRKEWSEKSRTLDKKISSQDAKIDSMVVKLADHKKDVESKHATKNYVDSKLDSFDVIATERYTSLKEDQHTMQKTLTGIEQLLTDERTRKLDSQASEIADLQKQLREQ